jgi:vitamin B12/bleomycin/antimicrobial peptide transport system ATP-binding/permease protein
MEMFTPTLDWGSEVWTSLVWIAKGWAIAAVATLAILVLIGKYTEWGRQFWRITGEYFKGPDPRASRSGCGCRHFCCR